MFDVFFDVLIFIRAFSNCHGNPHQDVRTRERGAFLSQYERPSIWRLFAFAGTYLKLSISVRHASKVVRSFTEGRVIPLASLVSPHGLMNAPRTPAASLSELKRRQPEVSAGDPRTTSAQILMVPPCQRNDTETPRICCCASRKSPIKLLKSFCASIGWKTQLEMAGEILAVVKRCLLGVWRVSVSQRWSISSNGLSAGFSAWAAPRLSVRMRNSSKVVDREWILIRETSELFGYFGEFQKHLLL